MLQIPWELSTARVSFLRPGALCFRAFGLLYLETTLTGDAGRVSPVDVDAEGMLLSSRRKDRMKLLFFDIDGTLINSAYFHFDVSEEVLKELRRVQTQGHKLFIASGRPAPLVEE